MSRCPSCNGRGSLAAVGACPTCRGYGTVWDHVCVECGGPLQWRCPACRIAQSADVADDALRADAERYRWLRGGKCRTTGSPKRGRIEVYQWHDRSEGDLLKGDQLDAAIDAALKEPR
jgi:RecJ-like exonuclease